MFFFLYLQCICGLQNVSKNVLLIALYLVIFGLYATPIYIDSLLHFLKGFIDQDQLSSNMPFFWNKIHSKLRDPPHLRKERTKVVRPSTGADAVAPFCAAELVRGVIAREQDCIAPALHTSCYKEVVRSTEPAAALLPVASPPCFSTGILILVCSLPISQLLDAWHCLLCVLTIAPVWSRPLPCSLPCFLLAVCPPVSLGKRSQLLCTTPRKSAPERADRYASKCLSRKQGESGISWTDLCRCE